MFPLVEGQTVLGVGGRYRFLSRLASGTFAVILKAVDTSTGQFVAIKCTHEPALNAIGEREAALLRELGRRDPRGHVAIVRLLDCFTQRRHVCLVLELLGDAIVPVGGGALQPWRQARPPPFLLNDRTGEPQHKLLALVYRRHHERQQQQQLQPAEGASEDEAEAPPLRAVLALEEIRQMAVHLCASLVFLHDQGLIHADLKPENIVHVDDSLPSEPSHRRTSMAATVKLVDFGNCIERRQLPLYKAEDAADESGGFDIQTLAYRAPEVAMGLSIAPAMDMWSLGCLLVECALGKPLFGETVTAADGSTRHSLTNSVELIDQIEWLLTGGVPLAKSRPTVYRSARFYKYRAKARGSVTATPSPIAATTSTNAAQHLPLRHRLDVSRPATISASEWLDFQDFVEQLLDVDPDSRMTARMAFLHPFLQSAFPFQFIFAPGLSAADGIKPEGIDTTPSDEEEEEQRAKEGTRKRGKSTNPRPIADAATTSKKKRHVTGSLRHALQLIPKPSAQPIKKEPTWG